ncbi:MAG: ABC transporter ATP-binding protein [Anaerolineae bacterium]|nr:ABC transporter ATP-binding protein [Anaerolineae bacterium]
MSQPLLEYQNVSFQYPESDQMVVSDFSLSLQAARATAIFGPNGAGKSTLLRLAYGRYRPSAGELRLAGKALHSYTRAELGKQVGIVPQREHTPFEYTILEYVLLGRAPYLSPLEMPGERDCQRAQEALAQVGMHEHADRSLHTLSGGELQLVLIARALAQEPRLLLLDEPTSHLDLANKKRLVDCLKALTKSGVSILLTSHEPEVVSAIADQIVLINRGRMLYSGTPDEVWTEELLSATYGISLTVEDVGGRKVVLWD